MSPYDSLQGSMGPLAITAVLGIGYAALFIARTVYQHYRWPLRTMPGPKFKSLITGSHGKVNDHATVELHEEWVKTYGSTFRFYGFLGAPMIWTSDISALRHILASGAVYQKSEIVRHQLGELVGEGLLFVEGGVHKRQRRVMNPAFGPLQVKKFTETFISKSNEMRDIWVDFCSRATRADKRVSIDAFAWLNKATLDIIGLAGFNFDMDALHAPEDQPNPLNEAVRIMFSFDNLSLGTLLQLCVPALRSLPTQRVRETARANGVIKEIGMQLIAQKKAAVTAESSNVGGNKLEKKDIQGSDLLSLLIKANMAADLPDEARLSDADILAQIPTFLVAGHETTSTAVAWALFALSCDRSVQAKLREELRAIPTDTPTDVELNGLIYLDYVLRESLRLYAPVYGTERTAVQDDVVSLCVPYTDTDGTVHHEIRVSKGDTFTIPIQIINRSVELWGEDAREFRPERWESLPDSVKDIPTIFSNMLTFISGAHACIGYRFSILEAKALLFAIVRSFEFELAVSPAEIVRRTMIVSRPSLDSNPGAGSQLPLLIRPVQSDM